MIQLYQNEISFCKKPNEKKIENFKKTDLFEK